MELSRPTLGIVGLGRVGTCLGRMLSSSYLVSAVSGGSLASRERAELFPSALYTSNAEVARRSDLTLLAVPDDLLAFVVAEIEEGGGWHGQEVLHTSGAHGVKVLSPAAIHGCTTMAVHPAMSILPSTETLPPSTLFGVTASDSDLPYAHRVVSLLKGEVLPIQEDARALYHAGLVGANHLTTLLLESLDMLRAAGVPSPEQIAGPLFATTLLNTLERGDAALTGPVSRGDLGTLQSHLDALVHHSPAMARTYAALALRTAERTLATHSLTSEAALPVLEALTPALGS